MLTFEHLIQINDPLMPLIDPLTRAQLWRGLWQRAVAPVQFVMGLESCDIQSREELLDRTILKRVLDFGPFKVHDEVTLTPETEVRVHVPATDRWPRSVAVVTIEEPAAGALFLRFKYELDLPDDSDDLDETSVEIRKQAYVAADMDTVQRIREMAAISRMH